jgi:hypothetical protein
MLIANFNALCSMQQRNVILSLPAAKAGLPKDNAKYLYHFAN